MLGRDIGASSDRTVPIVKKIDGIMYNTRCMKKSRVWVMVKNMAQPTVEGSNKLSTIQGKEQRRSGK